MPETDSQPTGVFASLHRLADGVVNTLYNRVELISVELQEEKCWLIWTMLWTGAAIAFGILAVVTVTVTVVVLSPESWQPYVLVAFSLLYLFAFVSAVSGVRRLLRERPPPLAGTIAELRKDIEWIRSRD